MPWLFRPPFFGSGSSNDFSGLFTFGKVQSEKSETDPPRRPAEVGLYCRTAMADFRLVPLSLGGRGVRGEGDFGHSPHPAFCDPLPIGEKVIR